MSVSKETKQNDNRQKTVRLQDVLITTDAYLDELLKFLFAICYGYKADETKIIFDKPHFLFIWPDRQRVRAYIIDESTLHTVLWFRTQFLRLFKVWGLMVIPSVILASLIVFNLPINEVMAGISVFCLAMVLSLLWPIKIGATARKTMNSTLQNCISVALPSDLNRSIYMKTLYSGLVEGGLSTFSEMIGTLVGGVFSPLAGKFASNGVSKIKELYTEKSLNDLSSYYTSVVLTEISAENHINKS